MNVYNPAQAPQEFYDAIVIAVKKSEGLACKGFHNNQSITFPMFLKPYRVPDCDVYIIDEKHIDIEPKAPEKYKLERFNSLINKLETKIKKHLGPLNGNLLEEILSYFNELHLLAENQNEKRISEKKRRRDRDKIVGELKNIKNENGPAIAKIIGEILNVWNEVEDIFKNLPIKMEVLGCFSPDKNRINIYYPTIKNSITQHYVNKYGEYVLAHEYFHAIHWMNVQLTPGRKGRAKWDHQLYAAHVRYRAVKESLAEYFALQYSMEFLNDYVTSHILNKIRISWFPAWAYAGADIFIEYASKPKTKHGFYDENPLFNAVYSASLIEMGIAYSLLDDNL